MFLIFALKTHAPIRRNYSLATNPAADRQLRFNVRIATPPRGQDCLAGAGQPISIGSSQATGSPPPARLAVFISSPVTRKWSISAVARAWRRCGRTCRTCLRPSRLARRVSFWYGARSRQEVFYQDYFDNLARRVSEF